jgi:hypothetical protein
MKTSLLFLALLAAGSAAAQTMKSGYRCTGADGSISFQDKPCASGQQSKSFEYQREPPPPPVTPEAAEAAPAETADARPEPPAMPAPPPPRPPAPVMYQCVRADNQKVYYSETGETRPYQVPAGVLGLPGSKLGANDGVSAPELNRPPVAAPGSATIATAYVEVQDRCTQMSPAEGCRVLRGQLDENLARQRSVNKAERDGLAVEAHRLADKLAGC